MGYCKDMSNLPRKEAVKALLTVLNAHRKAFVADYSGHHRDVATQIVDKCVKFTGDTVYNAKFVIEGDRIFVVAKRAKVAFIDLTKFNTFLSVGAAWGDDWATKASAYDWLAV